MQTKPFNIKALLRDNIRDLNPYASARDEFQGNSDTMIFLDANENPFNTRLNRYPDPNQSDLKRMISELKSISEHQILLGNGSDEVLDLIFRAFCNPKTDHVITLPPTYGMYEVLANINAVDVIKINLDTQFEPQVEKILSTQNEYSKLLFLCSPNNPSANSFESKTIVQLVSGFNGIVVIDEAYIDFSANKSWLNRLDEFQNLIVTQTFSKAFGLAGIRLGICFASEAIISILKTIKPPYNINRLTQDKAMEKLSELDKTENEINTIIEQRHWLQIELSKIPWINKVYPSDANFILVRVDDANKRYKALLSKGIVVRNRTTQPLCHNCLRITIGTEKENKTLLNIVKQLA